MYVFLPKFILFIHFLQPDSWWRWFCWEHTNTVKWHPGNSWWVWYATVSQNVWSKLLFNHQCDCHSYAISIVLCSLTLVVIVVLIVGLVLGSLGFRRDTDPQERNVVSNYGGNVLLLLVIVILPPTYFTSILQRGRLNVWVCSNSAIFVLHYFLPGRQHAQSVLFRCWGPSQWSSQLRIVF